MRGQLMMTTVIGLYNSSTPTPTDCSSASIYFNDSIEPVKLAPNDWLWTMLKRNKERNLTARLVSQSLRYFHSSEKNNKNLYSCAFDTHAKQSVEWAESTLTSQVAFLGSNHCVWHVFLLLYHHNLEWVLRNGSEKYNFGVRNMSWVAHFSDARQFLKFIRIQQELNKELVRNIK